MKCENGVKPAFIPSMNIQKDSDINWGLNGFCVEMDGDDKLQAMDSVTENLFARVSVVQCVLSEEQVIWIKMNRCEIDHKLKEPFFLVLEVPVQGNSEVTHRCQ